MMHFTIFKFNVNLMNSRIVGVETAVEEDTVADKGVVDLAAEE